MWPFTNSDPLKRGIDALFSRELEVAKLLLKEASSNSERPAVALSYLALVHRTSGAVHLADAALEKAKSLDDKCFEAYAAESIVRLTQKDIPGTIAASHAASEHLAHDLEGHFLKLLLFCLFAEMISHSEEGPDGAILSFKLTPVTRTAILLLDGRPKDALKEPPPTGDPGSLWSLARGLALYRNGDLKSAAKYIDAASVLLNQPDCTVAFEAFKLASQR
jgi:tetratricopeptide (TPR) repeat protein